jgi:purine catabolism regulator
MLTLGDLLDHEPLALRLLTGAAESRTPQHVGAHAMEMPQPARFLPPDWVMLTLGMGLRNRPEAQRALIAELDEAGICALGLGTGVAFQRVPPALLAAAEDRSFPVFEVPYETPYREIIGYVNGSLLSEDLRFMYRLTSLQQHLMDALKDPQPVTRLLERLGTLLGGTAVLFDGSGEVVAASGTVAAGALWQRLDGDQPSLEQALADECDLLSVPVAVDGQRARRLVILRRERSIPGPLAASLIRCVERLLELVMVSHQTAANDERSLRAELLRSALDPGAPSSGDALSTRIAHFGIEFDGSSRMFVFAISKTSPGAAGRPAVERLRNLIEELLDNDRAPHLLAISSSEVLCLTSAAPDCIRAWVPDLSSADGDVHVAGGRPIATIDRVSDSLLDARLALRTASEPGSLVLFEDASLMSWLISVAPGEALSAKLDALLGPLREHPQLHESLRVYIREGASIPAAARALNLHNNSLRYRITRIEKLLGRSVHDLSTLAELQLAFLAEDAEQPSSTLTRVATR